MSKRKESDNDSNEEKEPDAKQGKGILQATIDALNEEPPLAKFLIPASCSPGDKDLTHDTAKKITFSVNDEGRVCVYALWEDGTAANIVLNNAIVENSGLVWYKEGRIPAFVTIVTEKIVSLGCLSYQAYETFRPKPDGDDAKDPRVAAMFEEKDCTVVNLGAGSQKVFVCLPPLDPQERKELRDKAARQEAEEQLDLASLLKSESLSLYCVMEGVEATFTYPREEPLIVNGREVDSVTVNIMDEKAMFSTVGGGLIVARLNPITFVVEEEQPDEEEEQESEDDV